MFALAAGRENAFSDERCPHADRIDVIDAKQLLGDDVVDFKGKLGGELAVLATAVRSLPN